MFHAVSAETKSVAGLREKCHGANDAVEGGVPIFGYECKKCGQELEEIVLSSEAGHAGVHLYCRMEPRVIDAVDWFVPGAATLPLDSQPFGSFPMV